MAVLNEKLRSPERLDGDNAWAGGTGDTIPEDKGEIIL